MALAKPRRALGHNFRPHVALVVLVAARLARLRGPSLAEEGRHRVYFLALLALHGQWRVGWGLSAGAGIVGGASTYRSLNRDVRGLKNVFKNKIVKGVVVRSTCVGCSRRFPYGPDCILSHLGDVWSPHRWPTAVQSLTAFLGLDVAPLGSYHADCPILVIITVPRFRSGPGRAFATSLGRRRL